MATATKGFLKNGETIVWEDGNLVCVKKKDGQVRLTVKNTKSILKNKENKWIFKEEFVSVSKPEHYISIVRDLGTSRLLNLLNGTYITTAELYVKEKVSENTYLVKNLKNNKEYTINIKK